MPAVSQVVRIERRSQVAHPHAHGRQDVQVFDLRHAVHDERVVEASHVDPQRGSPVHVSLLPEDLQDFSQLQETHEGNYYYIIFHTIPHQTG